MITISLALLWPDSKVTILCMLAIGAVAFAVLLSLWRIYLHPLRNIPGPKLAACTDYYRIYFDTFRDGMVKTIPELHQHYSTSDNIAPDIIYLQDSRLPRGAHWSQLRPCQ
jgi:hypothetical protein